MANLYWLNQIRPNHLSCVGLKALYLSQVSQRGCAVVPGFVVSTRVLTTFLEQISWSLPLFADLPESILHLNIDDPHQLQAIAHELQQAISMAHFPTEFLAELTAAIGQINSSAYILRPSLVVEATSTKPQETFADVVLTSSGLFPSQVVAADPGAVATGVKQVWKTLFSAKSLFYWQRLNIPLHSVKLAILVQPIQSAIAAGTLRMVDRHLEVEATVGLGMALSRGEVVPDTYQCNVDGQLIAQQLGQRSIAYHIADGSLATDWLNDSQRNHFSLPNEAMQPLAQLMELVMTTLGRPVVLEWVLPDTATLPSVTQVIPLVTATLTSPVDSAMSATPAKKPLRLFSGASFIASGLAASGGQAIARASVITDINIPPSEIAPHTVLVAPTIPLNWIPKIQHAAALVSEQGSLTSHSAIVAREMGVPAVMGVANITQSIQSGELLWVDGDRGHVYRFAKSPDHLDQSLDDQVAVPATAAPAPRSFRPHQPLQTKLMVNISQVEQLPRVAQLAVDGVGLLRAELLALGALDGQHPLDWLRQHAAQDLIARLKTAIAEFVTAFYPRPVFYRSFDWRTHELAQPSQTIQHPHWHSPLGMRGTFSYLVDDTLFNLELQALRAVQQTGYDNVRLILPFVRTVEEFRFCRQRVQEIGLTETPAFQLWIMAEVPSILVLLPDYVEAGVEGISIGTNDLTQLLLGVDRDDPLMAIAFEERHPAIQRAIAQLVEGAHSLGIACTICGEAPIRYPEFIADLVQWGIDGISVIPEAVEPTYQAILKAEQRWRSDEMRSPRQ